MSGPYIPGQGLPLALPFGSSLDTASAQVSELERQIRGTNTPQTSSAERRLSQRALAKLNDSLPERDRRVLELVDQHRYLTTHQVQAFAFTGHSSADSAARTTRSVLRRLERSLLLRSLDRRIGGARSGSAARVWQITSGAARLLRSDGSTYRRTEPSLRFMAHCLAVADAHLALRGLTGSGADRVTVQVEPDSWRWFSGVGGERRSVQPDLAAVVQTAQYDDRWFVEVDLGTESLPTLLRKCGLYEDYRAAGIEQSDHGAFPLVLWVLTSSERAERFRRSIDRSPRLTPELHKVVTTTDLTSELREVLR
ncbi:hypothetical protein EUA06_22005 [Nocardioides glacieisoli]|uniref:Replication-relaxation n=1 Tax=Nocardioides glacieisoli TaxID=1168730 RepID=A0A4Q2RJ37_9ACTN|nr:replication-relaxation family protein [Nocardioides glacieisoli]RYB88266.1 hypothetical protein EUA06_22005 [Nocardioides glacieisoli]